MFRPSAFPIKNPATNLCSLASYSGPWWELRLDPHQLGRCCGCTGRTGAGRGAGRACGGCQRAARPAGRSAAAQ